MSKDVKAVEPIGWVTPRRSSWLGSLVTGSSGPIGAAIAKRLPGSGRCFCRHKVASNEVTAKEVADEINTIYSGAAVTIKADVSTVEPCKCPRNEILKAFGRIDIWF